MKEIKKLFNCRLCPPIAVAVCLVATISTTLVSGPLAAQYKDNIVHGCRKVWWMDVAFVSNYVFDFEFDDWTGMTVSI